jgi:hypothetical protein
MQVFSQTKQNPNEKTLIVWVFDGAIAKIWRIRLIEIVLF